MIVRRTRIPVHRILDEFPVISRIVPELERHRREYLPVYTDDSLRDPGRFIPPGRSVRRAGEWVPGPSILVQDKFLDRISRSRKDFGEFFGHEITHWIHYYRGTAKLDMPEQVLEVMGRPEEQKAHVVQAAVLAQEGDSREDILERMVRGVVDRDWTSQQEREYRSLVEPLVDQGIEYLGPVKGGWGKGPPAEGIKLSQEQVSLFLDFKVPGHPHFDERGGALDEESIVRELQLQGLPDDPLHRDYIGRDYTVNSIYLNLLTGEIVDPGGMGVQDVRDRILRTCKAPQVTIGESPIRILRGIYRMLKDGYVPAPQVEEAWRKLAGRLEEVGDFYLALMVSRLLDTGCLDRLEKLTGDYGVRKWVEGVAPDRPGRMAGFPEFDEVLPGDRWRFLGVGGGTGNWIEFEATGRRGPFLDVWVHRFRHPEKASLAAPRYRALVQGRRFQGYRKGEGLHVSSQSSGEFRDLDLICFDGDVERFARGVYEELGKLGPVSDWEESVQSGLFFFSFSSGDPVSGAQDCIRSVARVQGVTPYAVGGFVRDSLWRGDLSPPLHKESLDTQLLAVTDLPKETLDPSVWDLERNVPLLRSEHQFEITDRLLQELCLYYRAPERFISKIYLIGSETSYRWSHESDLDVTLLVDLEELALQTSTAEEAPLDQLVTILISELNGFLLGDTQHPVNYYATPVIPGHTPIYDVQEEKWVVPTEESQLIDLEEAYYEAWTRAREWAEDMDLRLGELGRDLIDLDHFRREFALMGEYGRKFVERKIRQRLTEIEEDIERLIDGYERVREERQRAFLEKGSGEIRPGKLPPRYEARGEVYNLGEEDFLAFGEEDGEEWYDVTLIHGDLAIGDEVVQHFDEDKNILEAWEEFPDKDEWVCYWGYNLAHEDEVHRARRKQDRDYKYSYRVKIWDREEGREIRDDPYEPPEYYQRDWPEAHRDMEEVLKEINEEGKWKDYFPGFEPERSPPFPVVRLSQDPSNPNWDDRAIAYKLLERWHYLRLLRGLKEVHEQDIPPEERVEGYQELLRRVD